MDVTSARQRAPLMRAERTPTRRPGFWPAVGELLRTVGPPFFIAMAVVVACASAIGLLLKEVLNDTALVRWDDRVVKRLEADRTEQLTSLTDIGNFVADPLPVAVLWGLAVIVVAILTRHWRPPFFVMVAIGGEKLSYLITTLIVDRPRPEVQTIGKLHVTSSFPSGHVGSAVSLYAGLTVLILALIAGRARRSHAWIALLVGLVFAAIVGYSRLYRGHHFPTDVFVGTLIGFAWVVVAYLYVLRPYLAERRERAERADHGQLSV